MADHRSTPWRHEIASVIFAEEIRAHVLSEVSAGIPLTQVMERYGLPDEVAYGRTRWDTEWRVALFRAQMQGRNPRIKHGSSWSYAHHKCRCPECRVTQNGCSESLVELVRRWRLGQPIVD